MRDRRRLLPGVGEGEGSGTTEDDDTSGNGENGTTRHEIFPCQDQLNRLVRLDQLDRTGFPGRSVALILAARQPPGMSTRTQLRSE
ncbi:hypothetical protein GCM10009540_79130 [Streptomyces turgidiscabies]